MSFCVSHIVFFFLLLICFFHDFIFSCITLTFVRVNKRHTYIIDIPQHCPSAAVVSSVGDVGDVDDQPCAMYETLSDDEPHSSRAPSTCELLRSNEAKR